MPDSLDTYLLQMSYQSSRFSAGGETFLPARGFCVENLPYIRMYRRKIYETFQEVAHLIRLLITPISFEQQLQPPSLVGF